MEYLRRPRDRPRKPDGRCRKHPKHRQSPGVCSLCLREKVSQLSSGGNTTSSSSQNTDRSFNGVDDSSCSSSSSSSSMSPYDESSSSGSSLASPVHHRYRFENSRSGLFGWNKNVLTKSRSIAFVPSGKGKEGGDESKGRGGTFWSKLIPGRGRKNGSGEGLKHSKTMRERLQ